MAVPALLSIAATIWLVLLYTGLGALMLRPLRENSAEFDLTGFLFKFALGFGLVGNGIMTLCFLNAATPKGIVLFLAALTVPAVMALKEIYFDFRALCTAAVRTLRRPHHAGSVLLVLVAGGYAARGLLPPTCFDSLMYHLAVPKLFLQHGGFWHVYFNPQADFPMLTHMQYMIGLAMGNDIFCKTLSCVIGFAALGAIACACRTFFTPPPAIVPSLLVFLTFTAVIASVSTCYVDIAQALWTLIAVLALDKYFKDGRTGYLLVSGVIAGMAVQTKVFGVFVWPVLAARLLLERKSAILHRKGLVELLLIFAPGILMGLPWYIKSFVHSGTILSIGHAVIEGQGLADPMGIKGLAGLSYWLANTVLRTLAAPWTFTLFPSQHQGDTFGALLIAVLPFLLLIKKPREVNNLLTMMGIYLACILIMEMGFIQGGSSVRYSFFILLCAAPCIVWAAGQLGGHPGISRLLNLMIICIVCLGSLIFFKRYSKDWVALITQKSRDAYLCSILPEYPVIQQINRLGGGKGVMPVYNFSNYYIDIPYVAAYRGYASEQELLLDLREKHIGYVFGNNTLDTAENKSAFAMLTAKTCIYSKNGFYLFKVQEAGGSVKTP
jgi:hypothetical protein